MARSHALLVLGSLQSVLIQTPAAAQLPEELAEVSTTLGCDAISDSVDRADITEPAYAYGFLPGPSSASAVFWCFRPADSATVLVAVRDGKLFSHFEWRHAPGALSIAEQRSWPLRRWRYVDDPETPGPAATTKHPPIRSARRDFTAILLLP